MENTKYLAQIISDFKIDQSGLPIIPFGELLTFLVRGVFIIAGLLALIHGLLGGIAWITSGGGKDEIQAARNKIQAAIVGIFILIFFLSIIWTMENVVFRRSICFGISCPISIPQLNIKPLPPESNNGVIDSNSQQQNNGNPQGQIATPTIDQQLPQTGGS